MSTNVRGAISGLAAHVRHPAGKPPGSALNPDCRTATGAAVANTATHTSGSVLKTITILEYGIARAQVGRSRASWEECEFLVFIPSACKGVRRNQDATGVAPAENALIISLAVSCRSFVPERFLRSTGAGEERAVPFVSKFGEGTGGGL